MLVSSPSIVLAQSLGSRKLISAPTTWYVDNVNGSDANDGSTPALAFKTINRAILTLAAQFDFAATPTLQLVTTGQTYAEAVNLGRWVGSASVFRIVGDPTNNAAVLVAPQNNHAFVSSHTVGCPWQIESLMVEASPNYYGIISDWGADVCVLDMNFGGCGVAHMFAEFGGRIEALWDARTNGTYTISGGAGMHVQSGNKGIFTHQLSSIVFQNNPTFTQAFTSATLWGLVNHYNLKGYAGARNIPTKFYSDGTGEIAGPPVGWP